MFDVFNIYLGVKSKLGTWLPPTPRWWASCHNTFYWKECIFSPLVENCHIIHFHRHLDPFLDSLFFSVCFMHLDQIILINAALLFPRMNFTHSRNILLIYYWDYTEFTGWFRVKWHLYNTQPSFQHQRLSFHSFGCSFISLNSALTCSFYRFAAFQVYS